MKSAVLALLLAAIGLAHAAEPRSTLDGWGPFKFSMSLTQAMAATRGHSSHTPVALEYPCVIDGHDFTAVVKFTDDEARISYINLVEKGAQQLDDAALAAGYRQLIATLTAQYGEPNSAQPPAADPDRSIGHIGPEAVTVFSFADGGQISVSEQAGWLAHLIVHYAPGRPHEGL